MIPWRALSALLRRNTYHRGAAVFADTVSPDAPPGGLRCVFEPRSGVAFVALGSGPHVGDRAATEAQAVALRPHLPPEDVALLYSPNPRGRLLALWRERADDPTGWEPLAGWSEVDERPEGGAVLDAAAALAAEELAGSASPLDGGFQVRQLGGGAVAVFASRGVDLGGECVVEPLRDGMPEPLRRAVDEYRSLAAARPPSAADARRMRWLRAWACASGDVDAEASVLACVSGVRSEES